jgi:HTH-type transcriptional regulator / antitoxin HigA
MSARAKHAELAGLPKSVQELVRLMPPMAIQDDIGHRNALEMIDRLMRIDRLSKGQGDYLETLVELVEACEIKRHAIDVSRLSGVQMLKFVLEQSGLSASDLGRLLKVHPTMGSKILKGERRLTWDHAKVLAARFKVVPALFLD